MPRRAQLAALLSGLLGLDLMLNLWQLLRSPVEDLHAVPSCAQVSSQQLNFALSSACSFTSCSCATCAKPHSMD